MLNLGLLLWVYRFCCLFVWYVLLDYWVVVVCDLLLYWFCCGLAVVGFKSWLVCYLCFVCFEFVFFDVYFDDVVCMFW